MKRILAAFAVASQIILSAPAAQPRSTDDERLDERVQAFTRQLRCLVCQNETLADSHAELAIDLKREIREQMNGGRTDEQILAFLTERYGDFVSYRPPLKPATYPLWFGPFALLGAGLLALYRQLTQWPERTDVRSVSTAERTRARRLLEIPEDRERA